MGVTVLITLALHIILVVWLSLSAPVAPPVVVPPPPLRVSLLMPVAETTVVETTTVSKPPPPPKPRMVERPKIQQPAPEVQQLTEPEPEPEIEYTEAVVEAPVVETPPVREVVALDAAASIRYEQLLVAWLEKHKKYPRQARRMRIEGEAILRILINRSGRTQQVTLEQGTGNRWLDKAVLEMAQRADPFPPMPEKDPRRELEFMVPVAFLLH
jgi:protein TonB